MLFNFYIMTRIRVTAVRYKYKNRYKNGIYIHNNKTNTFTIIDCKTLEKVVGVDFISEEQSKGNIFFNLKR